VWGGWRLYVPIVDPMLTAKSEDNLKALRIVPATDQEKKSG
jgi:hypothetical protein